MIIKRYFQYSIWLDKQTIGLVASYKIAKTSDFVVEISEFSLP